ncbi:MAG: zinc-dependent metalloprotease [Burkholderiales bacterium]|nr:zinc-dependent metalloprotease [Burkholderiales bacterium]
MRGAARCAAAALAALLWLAGCAQVPTAVAARPAAPAAALAASAPHAAASAPLPGSPPPFADVVKGASRIDGPLTMWRKDDKVWIEIQPAQFGQPFMLSPKIRSGISESWLLGGLMAQPINGAGGMQVVEFVRVHNQVRLQARNTEVVAKEGTPEARAVADAYSNSLLASVPVASAEHPVRKSVLVDAGGIFLNDLLGVGMTLQKSLHQGYGMDRANSLITAVRGSDAAVEIETQVHFYSAGLATPQFQFPPGFPISLPTPQLPRFVPDTRSLLVSLHYSLAPLPDKPMAPRAADPRVGFFSASVLDFSDDLARTPRQRHIYRWRLEKKEPEAAVSEPVKPIRFLIDRSVPPAYRETVRAAILEWNKAFAKIGFRDAIQVEQQADDASTDTLDYGTASVRWMMDADAPFSAIGPSHVDPRTGEILDADIAFQGMAVRDLRTLRAQVLRSALAPAALDLAPPAERRGAQGPEASCRVGGAEAAQAAYALDVLDAAGDVDPEGPLAQQFVLDFVKASILHEVGHALGLRHNFRASRAYTEAELADPEFTRAYGISGSVMDYNAINLPRPGQPGGMRFQTTLGPYDYWAIEYAYKPLPADITPAAERAALGRIAERGKEPWLAYGSDEDVYAGLDPETLPLDLGADPIAFASKRIAIARDLFKRQETRQLPPDRDYAVLRRSLGYALADTFRALGVLARQIGGVRALRDYPGSGREPLLPVSAAVQRAALDLMAGTTLGSGALQITPALQRRLAPDYLDREDGEGGAVDYALPRRLFLVQQAVLAYLLSDGLAARVLDAAAKVDQGADKPATIFQLGEVYDRILADVWGDLGRGSAIAAPRRELQRDYVNRLAATLLAPSDFARSEARALLRRQARTLLARLQAGERSARDAATRAHLADAAETLHQALAAPLQRTAL